MLYRDNDSIMEGKFRLGAVMLGTARLGPERFGMAGEAWKGREGPGLARRG